MTNTPAYLSQQVYDKLIAEGYLVDPEIMTVVYEEGQGGTLRTVAGYILRTPGESRGEDLFLVMAPIRYLDRGGSTAGPRMNGGILRTKLLVRGSWIITIKAESNA